MDNGSGETSELTLERRSVDLRPVRTRRLRSGSHTLGYLRITQFSEGVPEQVKEPSQNCRTRRSKDWCSTSATTQAAW